ILCCRTAKTRATTTMRITAIKPISMGGLVRVEESKCMDILLLPGYRGPGWWRESIAHDSQTSPAMARWSNSWDENHASTVARQIGRAHVWTPVTDQSL